MRDLYARLLIRLAARAGLCFGRRLSLDVIVAPSGSVIVLRSPQRLCAARRAEVVTLLAERSKIDGVRFALLDGEWEAVVIGAPE